MLSFKKMFYKELSVFKKIQYDTKLEVGREGNAVYKQYLKYSQEKCWKKIKLCSRHFIVLLFRTVGASNLNIQKSE